MDKDKAYASPRPTPDITITIRFSLITYPLSEIRIVEVNNTQMNKSEKSM